MAGWRRTRWFVGADGLPPLADVVRCPHGRVGRQRTRTVVLSDARVWAPGRDPLQGPGAVPFVRIRVAAISAWWLGTGR
jgi:hypothetical protein